MKKHTNGSSISVDRVVKYELLNPLLASLYGEVKDLSAKKQDLILNKVKVTMINRLLRQIRDLLEGQPTLEFIDLLDEETLPSNSDAVLVLSQYMSAMRQFHGRYYHNENGRSYNRWHTTDNP